MGHLDRTVFKRSTLKNIAESGCYLEWDMFGREVSYYPIPKAHMVNDEKRIEDIAWIKSKGYGDKVLIAQDICTKARLVKYGGHGYGYVPSQIIPRMRSQGYSKEAVHKILIDNPATAFTFTTPEP